MPAGKPAGVRCINLTEQNLCMLFGLPERPTVCEQFQAEAMVCGENREQALQLMYELEQLTEPL